MAYKEKRHDLTGHVVFLIWQDSYIRRACSVPQSSNVSSSIIPVEGGFSPFGKAGWPARSLIEGGAVIIRREVPLQDQGVPDERHRGIFIVQLDEAQACVQSALTGDFSGGAGKKLSKHQQQAEPSAYCSSYRRARQAYRIQW